MPLHPARGESYWSGGGAAKLFPVAERRPVRICHHLYRRGDRRLLPEPYVLLFPFMIDDTQMGLNSDIIHG